MPNRSMRNRTSPITLTMWDWSWLSHRVPGGAFEDWPKVLREARAHGFDTIRYDPLPDLVARPGQPREVAILPHDSAVPWVRVPASQTVDPVAESVALARAAVDEGLGVILSSWGLGRGREDDGASVQFGTYPEFRRFDDDALGMETYLTGWGEILDAFRSADLLEHVEYVDLNNESDLVIPLVSSHFPGTDLTNVWEWTPEIGEVFQALTERAVTWCHTHFPEVAATVSCCGPREVVTPWYPRNVDLVERHVWYHGGPSWEERSAALLGTAALDAPGLAEPGARARASAAYETIHAAAGPRLRRQQDSALEALHAWASAQALPVVLGEDYAVPWYSDLPRLSWPWIREVNEDAVATGQRLGFDGYATSNFSEPTFPLWEDEAWHRRLLDPGS